MSEDMFLKEEQEINARVAARRQRRKREKARMAMLASGGICVLLLLLYGFIRIQDHSDGEGKETMADGVILMPSEDIEKETVSTDGQVVYTAGELESMVNQAAEQAREQESERILGAIRESLTEGVTTVETLRPFYPEHLVVASNGKIHFVPIDRNLKQNELLQENIEVMESGEIRYMDGEQVISHKGIDVSSHQGDIDWNQVAADGVEFAMIRVGFRGYGSGKMADDEKFEANIQGAHNAGIKVGVYYFSQAVSEQEVQEEVEYVLNKIAPYQLDCPVVYDVEKVSSTKGRMNHISVEERTRFAALFCDRISQAGYRAMIYHNTEMGALMINLPQLEGYEKWYASYNRKMFYPYAFRIWQYSDKGHVQGIKTDVDLNICVDPVWETP